MNSHLRFILQVTTHSGRVLSKEFILKNIESNEAVLDLGSKLGDISNFIADKAKFVVGVDLDSKAIKIAKERYNKKNLSFEYGNANSFLEKTDKIFDVLILSHILEHIDDPINFLQRIRKYFKKIYIEVPNFDKTILNHYRKDKKVKLIYTDDDHVSEFDQSDLKQILEECE